LTQEFADEESVAASNDSRASPTRPLAELLARSLPMPAHALPAVVVGKLIAFADSGSAAVVSRLGSSSGFVHSKARSTVELDESYLGRLVVLAFEDGDEHRPIIMGVIRHSARRSPDAPPSPVQLDVDDNRVTITANEQLVLRCGKASLSMSKEGKVVVYGTYISSRSSGVHRIKGGSVEIN
jgi:hypothetical protein